jgi:hypothetical protein
MGFTTKKYGVSVSFFLQSGVFLVKPKAKPFEFWAEIWFFLKTHKNIYIGPLCVTDKEYGHYDQEM